MNPKTYSEFTNSLTCTDVTVDWSMPLKAMWFDAKGNWEASHDIAQNLNNALGCWIHAYLHRKEDDTFNAGYWYRLADKGYPKITLEEEFKEIVLWILEHK